MTIKGIYNYIYVLYQPNANKHHKMHPYHEYLVC